MSERRVDEIQIIKSSGNIYADLGVNLDVKDELKNAIAREICALIEERNLTQKDVAKILGTDQAKISNITRGRLSGFSVDRLVNFLTDLGYNIDIHFNRTQQQRGRVIVHPPVAAVG
ncbi:helix-turn-helix domain-containing protein [Nitratireductor soli]|uniref:helix-turn-helix domain-containing protein n=1 Tax=Nitratireductor soli TaxID=1670619 RepID=UPI0009E542A8|nr:helix-turn-helix transcriptional regulator [Nitratireductor soli]